MKGNNELNLNHATMIEAVQYYFDKVFVNAPVVKSVTFKNEYTGGFFVVNVSEREQVEN